MKTIKLSDATVLLTGGTGFLGRNILPELRQLCGCVVTLGRSSGNDVSCDLTQGVPSLPVHADIVVHAAGMVHIVPENDDVARAFFDVNVEGTRNLCRALETVGVPHKLVYVSSVAVYGCEGGEDVDENHPLNGKTPYAQSKIQAEALLQEWCHAHGVGLTILRAALIAGPDAPGNLGAMVRGIRSGAYVNVAGGSARKSLLMARDVARLLPLLPEDGGIYNICDGDAMSVARLSRLIGSQCGRRVMSIPYVMARMLAGVGDVLGSRFPINTQRLNTMMRSITFSNHKAVAELGWCPLSVEKNYKI